MEDLTLQNTRLVPQTSPLYSWISQLELSTIDLYSAFKYFQKKLTTSQNRNNYLLAAKDLVDTILTSETLAEQLLKFFFAASIFQYLSSMPPICETDLPDECPGRHNVSRYFELMKTYADNLLEISILSPTKKYNICLLTGDICGTTKFYPEAKQYYQLALQQTETIDNTYLKINCFSKLGACCLQQGKQYDTNNEYAAPALAETFYSESITALEQAIAVSSMAGSHRINSLYLELACSTLGLFVFYCQQSRLTEAVKYFFDTVNHIASGLKTDMNNLEQKNQFLSYMHISFINLNIAIGKTSNFDWNPVIGSIQETLPALDQLLTAIHITPDSSVLRELKDALALFRNMNMLQPQLQTSVSFPKFS